MKYINSTLFIILSIISYSTIDSSSATLDNGLNPSKNTLYLMNPKDINWSLKPDFLQKLINCFNVDVFIESGTYAGGTTSNALPYFKEIHTIELAPALYANAVKKFENTPNAHVYEGDSSDVLQKILPTIQGKILFWLDGHFSEGVTAKGKTNTPILDELKAIKNSNIKNAIILIDDIRCFKPFGYTPHKDSLKDYPSIKDLYKAVLDINNDYNFVIFGDIAIAHSKQESVISSPIIQACTISRLYENDTDSLQQVLEAEAIIAHACGEEEKALHDLFYAQLAFDSYNLITHYRLWHSLLLKDSQHAEQELMKIFELFPHDKRIQCHIQKQKNNNHPAQLHSLNIFQNTPDFDTVGYDNCTMESNGELPIIESMIKNGDIVFDVGANKGEWSQHVLASKSNIRLYAFEPIPTIFNQLQKNIAHDFVATHNFAISNKNGEEIFFYYNKNSLSSELSSFYERPVVNRIFNARPIPIRVKTKTLDSFCQEQSIEQIDFLKIDTEGSELNVLKGSSLMLKKGAIKTIQFEYGGAYLEAKATLKEMFDQLIACHYIIFRIIPNGLIATAEWSIALENYRYSNYLAVYQKNN
ncbi:MAG: FkbM family methyltransferase [Candidatus Dependentiae bacterium]|nr:FkbM family methyltransferase [Candidatus Dependentiae bacterium]